MESLRDTLHRIMQGYAGRELNCRSDLYTYARTGTMESKTAGQMKTTGERHAGHSHTAIRRRWRR
jgi:hypothetical protein